MKKLNAPMLSAIGALLLICVLSLSVYISGVAYQTPENIVAISDTDSKMIDNYMLEQNMEIAGRVDINDKNIKDIIKSLIRPDEYKAVITSTLYYDDTYGTLSCRQYVKENTYRVDYLNNNGGINYTQIYYNDYCYFFKNGASTFNKIAKGSFSSDNDAMIPTYEDILNIDDKYIKGSRMYEENGQMLIEIDTQIDKSVGIYRISLNNGLLYSADFSENGKMTRRVEVNVEKDKPVPEDFILAGQTQPIYESAN